ncbi:MAG: hypothetical protein U1G07_08690 [Verrucomicrobiota bacterium]
MLKGDEEYVAGDKHEACKAVEQTIPRSPGHMQEWFRMMKEGTPAYSNFDIAAYLTEIILLGCIALRVGEGTRVDWDVRYAIGQFAGGGPIRCPNNRPGWEV